MIFFISNSTNTLLSYPCDGKTGVSTKSILFQNMRILAVSDYTFIITEEGETYYIKDRGGKNIQLTPVEQTYLLLGSIPLRLRRPVAFYDDNV